MELAAAALALAAVGFLVSAYMTLAYYGIVHGYARAVPTVCRDTSGVCAAIVAVPEARVFGVPNSALGLIYYVLVISAAVMRIAYGEWWILPILLAASIVAAAFSLYLAWVLVFRLRAVCLLCFAAQLINLTLLGIIAAAL